MTSLSEDQRLRSLRARLNPLVICSAFIAAEEDLRQQLEIQRVVDGIAPLTEAQREKIRLLMRPQSRASA